MGSYHQKRVKVDCNYFVIKQNESFPSMPVGTYLEALQGWLLKLGEESKILFSSTETFVDWIANVIPPWEAYRAFLSGRLIVLDK